MEIFGGLNSVSLSGFVGVFMLKESGLIFKSPVATVSRTHHLGSFIMSMPANATWHVRHCAPYPFCIAILSVLIGFHVIHPNTSVSSVNEHC